MSFDMITVLGFSAGIVTSLGFIPQLIRGFRTKKLDDVSYYMPFVLAGGMSLWFIYGILLMQIPIICANAFGISCNIMLVLLKIQYSKKNFVKTQKTI